MNAPQSFSDENKHCSRRLTQLTTPKQQFASWFGFAYTFTSQTEWLTDLPFSVLFAVFVTRHVDWDPLFWDSVCW